MPFKNCPSIPKNWFDGIGTIVTAIWVTVKGIDAVILSAKATAPVVLTSDVIYSAILLGLFPVKPFIWSM